MPQEMPDSKREGGSYRWNGGRLTTGTKRRPTLFEDDIEDATERLEVGNSGDGNEVTYGAARLAFLADCGWLRGKSHYTSQ